MNFGMIKKIDKLGRVVIPIEYRRCFKMENEVELVILEEGILIRSPGYKLVNIADGDNPDSHKNE